MLWVRARSLLAREPEESLWQTLEQRPEGTEGGSFVGTQGESIPGRGNGM